MNSQALDNYCQGLHQRSDIEIKLRHLREDLEGRQLYLTPTGEGYKGLGSSEGDRKNVMEKL
jgi:myo-inositol-hexaphosphate 3-phosphohydrolase